MDGYIVDTNRLQEIRVGLERSKTKIKNNTISSSGNIYLDKIIKRINEIKKMIDVDYSKLTSRIDNIISYSKKNEEEIENYTLSLEEDVTKIEMINTISTENSYRIYRDDGAYVSNEEEDEEVLTTILATTAVGTASLAEGVLDFGEDIVKGLWIAANAVTTVKEFVNFVPTALVFGTSYEDFKDYQANKWDGVKTFVTTDHVKSAFDNFYDNTSLGQTLKDNSAGFDTVRNIGNTVGYIGASVVTGGVVSSALGVGASATSVIASSAAKAGVNAAVYGVSRVGSNTEDAWNSGASITGGLAYGATSATYQAGEMFVGSMVNSFTPFGTGTTTKTLANAASHVTIDTAMGTADPIVNTAIQTVTYTPDEETLVNMSYNPTEEELQANNNSIVETYKNSSFSEKYSTNFNANGGWSSVGTSALFSGAMSLLSETSRVVKEITDINKASTLYSKMKDASEEYNAIKNNSSLDIDVKISMIDDLESKQIDLLDDYNNLTNNQKYAFQLKSIKEGISEGNISVGNSFMSSDYKDTIWNNLKNSDKIALVDTMDENQIKSLFSEIGDSNAQKFLNKNSSYFSKRFFDNNSSDTLLSLDSTSTSSKDIFNSVSLINVDVQNNLNINQYKNNVAAAEEVYLQIADDAIDDLGNITSSINNSRSNALSYLDLKNNIGIISDMTSSFDELEKTSKKVIEDLTLVTVTTTSADSSYSEMSNIISNTRRNLLSKISDLKKESINIDKNTSKAYSSLIEEYKNIDNKLVNMQNKIDIGNKSLNDSISNFGKNILNETDQSKIKDMINSSKDSNTEVIDNGITRSGSKVLTADYVKEKYGVETSDASLNKKIGFQFFAESSNKNTNLSELTNASMDEIFGYDDEKFISFVKSNSSNDLFSNEEILDRAISLASDGKFELGLDFNDEIQHKIVSNKEYVQSSLDRLSKLPFPSSLIESLCTKNIVNNITKLSSENLKTYIDNVDFTRFNEDSIIEMCKNISDYQKQDIFIEKLKLLDNIENMKKYETISYIKQLDIKNFLTIKNALNSAFSKFELNSTTDVIELLNITDVDYVLDIIENQNIKFNYNSLMFNIKNKNNIKLTADLYLALAKRDMIEYVSLPSTDELFKDIDGITMLEYLLDKDTDLTVNKILTNCKSDPKIAIALKGKGIDIERVVISTEGKDYFEGFWDDYTDSLGVGPLRQEAQELLNDLNDLFLSDGKSDEKLVKSLVSGYRNALLDNYDQNIQELRNLVNVKKQNLDKFYIHNDSPSGYFSPVDYSIHVKDSDVNTLLHETTHALHFYLKNLDVPVNYEEVTENLRKDSTFLEKVANFTSDFNEKIESLIPSIKQKREDYFKDYYTEEQLEEIKVKLSKTVDEKIKEYSSLGLEEDELRIILENMFTLDEYIREQKNNYANQMISQICNIKYYEYFAISDIIDAVYEGKYLGGKLYSKDGTVIQGNTGHSLTYYYATEHGFDEMVANFGEISKSSDSAQKLQLLKDLVGEELYNMLSEFYNKNIQGGNNGQ